jgi:antitoxin component of MazEF toxin-antitoxin module
VIAELRAKAQVTVPREIVSELGLRMGDKFDVSVHDGAIYMIPVAVYPKNYVEKLEAQVREAKALIESGDLMQYSNADDLIAALRAESGDGE